MRILSRYIIFEILKLLIPLWLSLGFLLFILEWLAQVFNYNASATIVLMLYAYKIPSHLEIAFPLAVLLSMLIVLGSLNRAREIVAAQSMGISDKRILLPCFVALVGAASLNYLVMNKLAPWGLRKHYEILDVEINKVPSRFSQIKKERIWYRNQDVLYNARFFDPDKNELVDVTIYTFDDDFYIAQKVFAERAEWKEGYWLLHKGVVYLTDKTLSSPVAEKFETRSTTLIEDPATFKRIEISPRTMRQAELRSTISRNKELGIKTAKWEVVYYNRYSFFLISFVFLFLAFPVAMRFRRNYGIGKDVVFTVTVSLVYWLFYNFSMGLGGSEKISPIVGAWAPSLTALVLVGIYFKNQSLKKFSD